MPQRFLRASLYLLLTITSLGIGTMLHPANAFATSQPVTAKARVAPSLTSIISSAFLCVTYCCGSILDMGSWNVFGLQYAWVDMRVACQDGSVCYTTVSAICAGDICDVSFEQSGNCE